MTTKKQLPDPTTLTPKQFLQYLELGDYDNHLSPAMRDYILLVCGTGLQKEMARGRLTSGRSRF